MLSQLSLLSVTVALVSAISIVVPPSAPGGSLTISPSLLSLSIEGDRWPDWSGSSSPNQFFVTILDNIKNLVGSAPNIRVGADSEDRTDFNPNVTTVQAHFPPPSGSNPFPEGSNVTVGDDYYAFSRFMPSGTHMAWGINFGTNNLTAATDEAKSILKAFAPGSDTSNAGVVLDLIEIGNEPDLYGNNHKRPSNWSIATYVNSWSSFAGSVASAVGIEAGSKPGILGLAFAGSDHGAGGFSPAQAFADGILSEGGKSITTVSLHLYFGTCCNGTVQDLMLKTNIRSHVTKFASDIKATVSNGLKFVFGETNTASGHGIPNVSDAGGAAIWLADYSLFAATQNVSNLYFHQGVGYKYNWVQPVALNISTEDGSLVSPPTPPHVQATYYGVVAVAEFLGTVSPRVVTELNTNSSTLSGYALFNGGAVKKVLLINSQPFLTTTSGARPSQNITLTGAPEGNMLVKRLSIPQADDKTGLTWGGQMFADDTGKLTGTLQTTTINTTSVINIAATELVLLTFQ